MGDHDSLESAALRKLAPRSRRRIPYVQQLHGSDCAAACLAMTLRYHGREIRVDALRETKGQALAVKEEEIAAEMQRASRAEGLQVGPEGAACFLALSRLIASGDVREGQRVVVFQTGHPANYAE